MPILSNTDFTGRYAIAQDQYSKIELDQYIAENEFDYLVELLGTELATSFVDDLVNGVPQSAEYLVIFNEFTETVDAFSLYYGAWVWTWEGVFGCERERQIRSKGIKFYLKARLYFDFVRDYAIQPGIGSNGENENTNTQNAGYNMAWLCTRFNEGIHTGKAIQWYILQNQETYETFSGNPLDYSMPL